MKFAKGHTQPALNPQHAPSSGAASVALQHSPLLQQQAAQLMAIRHGAQQQMQRKQQPLKPAHPLAWITQLENYPADSTGTIDKIMAKAEGESGDVDVSGTQIQKWIIDWARKDPKGKSGYRLGSYDMSNTGSLKRKVDNVGEELHGMEPITISKELENYDPWIIIYIKNILKDAGQWDYIIENEAAIFANHRVIVDVDCQFDRTGNVGFHKDSRGSTAFVNLTFSNDEPMTGTDNYEDLEGDPGLEEELPGVVKFDIAERRDKHKLAAAGAEGLEKKDATSIRGERLPSHGRISFSDPNLYHSTPRMGHRYKVASSESMENIKEHLIRTQPKHTAFWNVASDQQLRAYMEPYNLHGFEKKSSFKGEENAHTVAKSLATQKRERRLSQKLDDHSINQSDLEQEAKIPRTFIRTWVRFVKVG